MFIGGDFTILCMTEMLWGVSWGKVSRVVVGDHDVR